MSYIVTAESVVAGKRIVRFKHRDTNARYRVELSPGASSPVIQRLVVDKYTGDAMALPVEPYTPIWGELRAHAATTTPTTDAPS